MKSKGTKIINFLFIILIILLGIFLYTKYIGVKGLIVKEYRIESKILTDNFSGVKIIHISDILYGSTVNKEDINNIVKKVNILKPDIVVFTGDLIKKNIKLKDKDKEYIIERLSNINSKISKYAIKGDHDYSNDYYEDIMTESGFKILSNSYDEIYYENNEYINIVGLPSMQKDKIKLEEAFSFYNDENRKYIILLVHEGNTIKEVNKTEYEVDLILGGHSLNGSIVIPYYGPLFIDKHSTNYYLPEYEKGITKIFISSGVGTDIYPYRFNNKPSINLYRLKKE